MLQPSRHLFERMRESSRGFSQEEVHRAVYAGSKHYVRPDKYRGRYGRCVVIVYIRRCHLSVSTVEEA